MVNDQSMREDRIPDRVFFVDEVMEFTGKVIGDPAELASLENACMRNQNDRLGDRRSDTPPA